MNLHEYQAKSLLAKFGVPVPAGKAVFSAKEAIEATQALGGNVWVVKAQVHAGGRGKAGGVKVLKSREDVEAFANSLLGKRLVTHQTNASGQPIDRVLVEAPSEIARELYLACLTDRATERVTFIASTEGGMEIEEVAANHPEKILKAAIEPSVGLQPYQCRNIGFALGLTDKQVAQLTKIMLALYECYNQSDLALLEINPLVVTKAGDVMALDAKIQIDDNALYRQKDIADLRDASQDDPKEVRAQQHEINYVALEGNIGCMVNGAGLAMATMDLIKLHGGQPANFLDVGGGATAERVTTAFEIILSDPNVKAILINIFGGIVRCDLIAEGVIAAMKQVKVTIPVVVRLEGTNVDKGREMLKNSGLKVIAADNLTEAAKQVVAAAK
ncbi:MAG TPA: ADP-forming succinate--CoA ligase subunit beta [Burkholderiales bacterium]|nr:ADP-forming succinate--CoA ligase subunit beta [Burkholderiales bacterium]